MAANAIPEEPEGGKDKETVDFKDMLKNGRYYLIPSFFYLLRQLKKAKRDFSIVFRTFGTDLPALVSEFNA